MDCTGSCSVADILAGRVTKHSVLVPDIYLFRCVSETGNEVGTG